VRLLPPLAAIFHVPKHLGYVAVGVLVGIESSGIPVPGETALITGAVLASTGGLRIELVIAIAAGAAIVGDNVGYLLGRRFGRKLLERPGRGEARRLAVLVAGEDLFERHGPKAVFFGRWIAGLRIWVAWLAGITRMHWTSFLAWNALGGIAWASFFGLLGYWAGEATAHLIATVGTFAGLGIVALIAILLFVLYRRGRLGRLLHPVGLEAGEELVLARRVFDALSQGELEGVRDVLDTEIADGRDLIRGARLRRLRRREGRVLAHGEARELRVAAELHIREGRVVEATVYVEEDPR
jgi:membrane protein DedA with SNARE-associated domain